MDFGLESHQDELVRTAGSWIDRSWTGGDRNTVAGRRELWTEVAEIGWPDLLGGDTSGSTLDAALVIERLGRGGCSLPVAGAAIAATLTDATGPSADGAVDQLLSGDAGATARGLELADRVVVVDLTGSGTIGVVELEGPDDLVVVRDEQRLRLSRPTGSPDRLVDLDPTTTDALRRLGAVLSAAELVGCAQGVLDDAVTYAGDRIQGGKPIGGHQAIQHRLADMVGHVERARFLTYAAAEAIDRADDTATMLSHRAKGLAARDALIAIRSAHQVMGAIGFSAEHDLQHVHKQALVAAAEFGGASHHWGALETGLVRG